MNITFTEDDPCFPPLWSVYYILYGILVFLGNQLVYLYRPTQKYTYQITISSFEKYQKFQNHHEGGA